MIYTESETAFWTVEWSDTVDIIRYQLSQDREGKPKWITGESLSLPWELFRWMKTPELSH